MNKQRVDLATLLPPKNLSIEAAQRLVRLASERGELFDGSQSIFATRTIAREVVAELPDGQVTLNCNKVDVMSPPFIDELLKLRPDITAEGLNDDCASSWSLVMDKSNYA